MIVTITRTIDSEQLVPKFRSMIYAFSDNRKGSPGGFITYADVSALTTALYPFLENEFEEFVEAAKDMSGGPEEIRRVGWQMLEILNEIETDDDFFPRDQMKSIAEVCGIDDFVPREEYDWSDL